MITRGRGGRRRSAAAAGAIVLLLLGGVGARASAAGAAVVFAGSCRLAGTVRFTPPLTALSAPGAVDAAAAGTCTGTLRTGGGPARRVDDVPVTVTAASRGSESCASGRGTGAGVLAVDGQRLAFLYSELRTGPGLLLAARGARGGSAVAEANVSPDADPAGILAACASGGLPGAPIDVTLTTGAGAIAG